jgi:hypothetical protein
VEGATEQVLVEEIILHGKAVTALKELLRPGLKAVFVGLNPPPVSVASGTITKVASGDVFGSAFGNTI